MLHGQNVSPARLSDRLFAHCIIICFQNVFVCARYSIAVHLITEHIHNEIRTAKRRSSEQQQQRARERFFSFCFVCKNSIEYVCHVVVLLFLRLSFSLSIFRFHSTSTYTALLCQTAIIINFFSMRFFYLQRE